jgi:hypothetical protein
MAPLEELDDSTRRTRKLARGRFVVKLYDTYYKQRVHIYTLVLTRLLVDHDYNIYCLKLTTWRHVGLVSIINSLPSLYPVHVSTHSRTFPPSTVEKLFCRMMTHSRPQTPLPNALKEISCRMVFSCQIRPTCQYPLIPIFGVNICPFNYGIKDDFIPELTINAKRPQAKSVQHLFFPPSNCWSFRPDPKPSSSTFQASSFKWRTKILRLIRYYFSQISS